MLLMYLTYEKIHRGTYIKAQNKRRIRYRGRYEIFTQPTAQTINKSLGNTGHGIVGYKHTQTHTKCIAAATYFSEVRPAGQQNKYSLYCKS